MRVTLALLLLAPLAGCSNLLGIQDPSPGEVVMGDGGGGVDAMVPPSGDIVKMSLGDFQEAKNQRVRLRVSVMNMHTGAVVEVTKNPSLSMVTSSPGVATIGPLTDNAVTIEGLSAGTSTITAKFPDAADTTLVVTVSTFVCHPVINEFTTGTTDGVTNLPDNEFVEIYNPCNAQVTVDNWTLDYRPDGSTSTAHDSRALVTLSGTLNVNEYRVYAGSQYLGPHTNMGTEWTGGLAKDAGAIALRNGPADTVNGPTAGMIVDSVAYGDPDNYFAEVMGMAGMAYSETAARMKFDGNDTGDATHDGDNSKDFAIITTTAPTPGAPNVP